MQDTKPAPVVPGPCQKHGCPPPTEIVCIETLKVYDFCFQNDSIENACFPIPASCSPPVPANVKIRCSVAGVTSSVLSVSPLSPPAPKGFVRVTIQITVNLTFKLLNNDGTTRCIFGASFPFMKTVALCAPKGTDVIVEVATSRCGPCFVLNGNQVCCEVDICMLIQSRAVVKLLIPAYGFCTPAECVELPKAPMPCPPIHLFPAQCTAPVE